MHGQSLRLRVFSLVLGILILPTTILDTSRQGKDASDAIMHNTSQYTLARKYSNNLNIILYIFNDARQSYIVHEFEQAR
jgi:hypothetical protein